MSNETRRTSFCNLSTPEKFKRGEICENFNAIDTIVDSSKDIFIKQNDPVDSRTVDNLESVNGARITVKVATEITTAEEFYISETYMINSGMS